MCVMFVAYAYDNMTTNLSARGTGMEYSKNLMCRRASQRVRGVFLKGSILVGKCLSSLTKDSNCTGYREQSPDVLALALHVDNVFQDICAVVQFDPWRENTFYFCFRIHIKCLNLRGLFGSYHG